MAPSLSRGIPFVYILQLRSGALYVGCSNDVEDRFERHSAGRACRTTTNDPPIKLLFVELHASFVAARRREAQLKRWSFAKKQALVHGDLNELRNLSRGRG